MNARELIGISLGPHIDILMALQTQADWVMADADQLSLAILNLALNARDAMPQGGEIRIESVVNRQQSGTKAERTRYVAVRVIDTGLGMPPEVAARAVEPFFTTKERGKGTGLGLSQVYGFVHQCGGELVINSELGRGTTVEILLPWTEPVQLKPPPQQGSIDASKAPIAAVHRDILLVIDDDEAVRGIMVDALTVAGYEVVQSADGPSALVQLDHVAPAAAIIDFLMPGMDGAEVAHRAQMKQPGLPIVFVSGYYDTVALDHIPGAIVLRKPFTVDALNRAVAQVLQ
jgi:CheY-like chemotaxis protein/anti-sigma regulatory factor (Ser/Thr protein kinase)